MNYGEMMAVREKYIRDRIPTLDAVEAYAAWPQAWLRSLARAGGVDRTRYTVYPGVETVSYSGSATFVTPDGVRWTATAVRAKGTPDHIREESYIDFCPAE